MPTPRVPFDAGYKSAADTSRQLRGLPRAAGNGAPVQTRQRIERRSPGLAFALAVKSSTPKLC